MPDSATRPIAKLFGIAVGALAASGPSVAAAQGPAAAPSDGGPRYWAVTGVSSVLNLRALPSTDGAILERLAPNTVLDNLGCDTVDGRIWCDVQPIDGGARGYVAADFLAHAVGPDGRRATGADTSAERAGRGEFDARGVLSCSSAAGAPMVDCAFGVARSGGGDATVVVNQPDGPPRALFFRFGRAIGADLSEADGDKAISASKGADSYRIRVGDERYNVPEAVVFGG
ncbi:MAG: SH3 domain-containing protein [Pseudomonadota bacterium]